ncbi:hypothetical protein ACUY2G_04950 [Corynebacterium guaraldiae]
MSLPLTMHNIKELLRELYDEAAHENDGTAMTTILYIEEQIEVSFHE